MDNRNVDSGLVYRSTIQIQLTPVVTTPVGPASVCFQRMYSQIGYALNGSRLYQAEDEEDVLFRSFGAGGNKVCGSGEVTGEDKGGRAHHDSIEWVVGGLLRVCNCLILHLILFF